jgi:hypothetical protein
MERDPVAGSSRRIAVRALLLLAPLVVLGLAAPRLLAGLRERGNPADTAARADRAPTDAERRASATADRDLSRLEQESLGHSEVLAPEGAKPDAAGEHVRRFQGFGVSVESVPAGAWVRANGEELGTTPLVASVSCTPGAPVAVEVGGARLRTVRRTVTCRADALVELSVRLER